MQGFENMRILKDDWGKENIKNAFDKLKAKSTSNNFDLLIGEIELCLQQQKQ